MDPHGGEEHGEGGELSDVQQHHVLVSLLGGSPLSWPQARSLYHHLNMDIVIVIIIGSWIPRIHYQTINPHKIFSTNI